MQTYTTEKTPGLRNGDGKVKILPAFLLTLYITAMAVLISIVFFTDIIDPSSYLLLLASIGAPAIGIALCSMLTTSVKPLVPFCIIVAIMIFLGANITLSSMIASFFLLVAISAYLLRDKLWALVILATLGASAIAYFISGNALLAISCAIFLPISIALCLSFKKRKLRKP